MKIKMYYIDFECFVAKFESPKTL